MELLPIPGPKGRFFLGHLPERRKAPLRLFVDSALEYGDLVHLKFGPRDVFLVNHPDLIKEVLQDPHKRYCKGFGYDQLQAFAGKGLLTSEGEFWRTQRRLIQPAFHRERLVEFSRVMVQCTVEMADSWASWAKSGKVFNIADEMNRLTLQIISRTMFSSDVQADAKLVSQAVTELVEEVNHRMLSVIHIFEYLPTPKNLRYQRALRTLNEVLFKIINSRRQSKQDTGDLLSMLMMAQDEETGKGMSDQQLRDEAMTIFLAGHETTANLLAWTWYLLSKYPDVDRKFRREIQTVLQGRLPSFEDLPKLQYTSMVIDESLRIFPPVWILSRDALVDHTLGAYRIPKRGILAISPYVSHRVHPYWENPEGFDPERFAPGTAESRPKNIYFPFGGGPRQCIGNNFALMEAKLILATLAQRYGVRLKPGAVVEPEPLITLRPKHGVPVVLTPMYS